MNNTDELNKEELNCQCGNDSKCHDDNHECHCDDTKKDKIKRKDKKSNKELEELKKENMDLKSKLMYAQADNINYRKRKDEETANLLKFANQDLIMDLIEMVDNLGRASEIKVETEEAKKIQTGIQMVNTQFKDILTKYGVVEIEALGYPFDANYMEAMMIGNETDKPDELVLEVLMKGYKFKDRVIKPAVVKVNKIEDNDMKGND